MQGQCNITSYLMLDAELRKAQNKHKNKKQQQLHNRYQVISLSNCLLDGYVDRLNKQCELIGRLFRGAKLTCITQQILHPVRAVANQSLDGSVVFHGPHDLSAGGVVYYEELSNG